MEKDNETMRRQIKRLQDNLLSIRKIAGWTAEELGDKIGVTKQTISNLENGLKTKTKMTQTQYIAIRSILEYEMRTNQENTVLPQVISILLDSEDDIDTDAEKYDEIKKAINTVAATAAGGIAGAQLAAVAGILLAPFSFGISAIIGAATIGAAFGWLNPFMKKNKKNTKTN